MMATLFQGKDHAQVYAQSRPSTPPELISRVLNFLREQYTGDLHLAVDVGCGSGQNTFLFSEHFENVIGTDVSGAQIEVATTSRNDKPNVTFAVHPSHEIPAMDGSVELITAATAAHWFDLPKFFAEGDRVLRQNGVMALYSYNMFPRLNFVDENGIDKSDQLNGIVQQIQTENLAGCFDTERRQIARDEYRSIVLPMRDLTREFGFINHYRTSLQNLAARLKSSSGFQTYCRLNGEESGENIVQDYLTDVYLLLGENFEEMSPETIVFDAKETWFVVMARK